MNNSSADDDPLYARLAAEKEHGFFHEALLQQAWSMANGVESEAGVIYDNLRLEMLRLEALETPQPPTHQELPVETEPDGLSRETTPLSGNLRAAKRSRHFRRILAVTIIVAISSTTIIWAVQWYRGRSSPQPLVTERTSSATEQESERLFDEAAEARKVPEGLVAAFPAYLKAAEAGSPGAMITVAECYRKGVGTGFDDEKAVRWEKKALSIRLAQAEKGDADAQQFVAGMYRDGTGTSKNDAEAAKWEQLALESISALAEDGDADAQVDLFRVYLFGLGIQKNEVKAAIWLTKAAEQGNAYAQSALGAIYMDGRGLPKDNTKAVEWLRKSADQGHHGGQWLIGSMYADGKGVSKDPKEAVEWYRKAAEKGDVYAQRLLASMFQRGEGVPKSAAKAMGWFRRAADQGDPDAQCDVGQMFLLGEGVPKDKNIALQWYHRAAAQGNVGGQHSLGRIYAASSRTTNNLVQGYKWLALAAAADNADAKTALGEIETRMSPGEISEAQRLAADFVPLKAPEFPGLGKTPSIASRGQKESHSMRPQQRAEEGRSREKTSGTGFFITADGYLMTAQHVVEGAKTIKVRTGDGTMRTARILREDKKLDFALLKIEMKDCSPLSFVPNSAATLGLPVMTVGFPNPDQQGTEPKYTDGKISSLSGAFDDAGSMQVSVPVQPGNSGGALTDTAGQVLGMVTHRLDALKMLQTTGTLSENVNYAVKSGQIRDFLKGTPAEAGLVSPSPSGEPNPVIPASETIQRVSRATVLVVVEVDR